MGRALSLEEAVDEALAAVRSNLAARETMRSADRH